MERTSEFERRALDAAGPVFLVALGVLLLLVLAVTALVAPLPTPFAFALLALGGVALGVGLAWGVAKNGASAGEG